MKIKVHYIFSKNKKIGSKIISWGTNHLEPNISDEDTPSHVAILVNERWIFESTLESGVRRIAYEEWLKINREVGKFESKEDKTIEDVLHLFRQIKDKKYDYKGIIFFGWRLFLNKAFKTPIPKDNKWQSKDAYFCCEVLGTLLNIEYEMTAPVQIMVQAAHKCL